MSKTGNDKPLSFLALDLPDDVREELWACAGTVAEWLVHLSGGDCDKALESARDLAQIECTPPAPASFADIVEFLIGAISDREHFSQ